MSEVASPSAAATPSRALLKRCHDSSSDDDICPKKRYFYVLAPESSDYSSDGPESIYSVQAKSTDVARDTSDTSTKDSWSDFGDGPTLELEVVSLSDSDDQNFPFLSSPFSSPEDLGRVATPGSESGLDFTSGRSAECSVDEGENAHLKSLGLHSHCILCKQINSDPHFMFCLTCYRRRRSYLPERPRRRKKRDRKITELKTEDAHDSGIYSQSSSGTLIAPLPLDVSDPSSTPLCQICMVRPRDGGFCHDNIVHVYSCYQCSLKTFKQRGRCPVCNRRPKHVNKLIIV